MSFYVENSKFFSEKKLLILWLFRDKDFCYVIFVLLFYIGKITKIVNSLSNFVILGTCQINRKNPENVKHVNSGGY